MILWWKQAKRNKAKFAMIRHERLEVMSTLSLSLYLVRTNQKVLLLSILHFTFYFGIVHESMFSFRFLSKRCIKSRSSEYSLLVNVKIDSETMDSSFSKSDGVWLREASSSSFCIVVVLCSMVISSFFLHEQK